jgi:hypothetical protein
MTVSYTASYIEYTATGAQTVFAIPFPFLSDSTLVHVYDNTDGLSAATEYTQGVDFTISGTNVTFGVAPAADTVILVRRITPLTQATDYPEGGGAFPATSHENALDKLTLICQELRDKLTLGDLDLERFMQLSADGEYWEGSSNRIGNVGSAEEGTDAVNLNDVQALITGGTVTSLGAFTLFEFTGDGTATEFTTTLQSVVSAASLLVYFVGGLIQDSAPTGGSYTIDNTGNPLTGTKVVFGTAPGSGVKIRVLAPTGTVLSTLAAITLSDSNFASGTIDPVMLSDGTNGQALMWRSGTAQWDEIAGADIGDLDAVISAYSLSDFAVPSANLAMGSKKITGLADGVSSNDAANVGQLAARRRTKSLTVSLSGTSSSKTGSATFAWDACGIIFSGTNGCSGCAAFHGNNTWTAYIASGSSQFNVTIQRSTSGSNKVVDFTVAQGTGSPTLPTSIDVIGIEGDA